MQQMNSEGQPQYRGYEGSPQDEQARSGGRHAPGELYDDDFMEAFAQRLSQRMAQGPSGKITPTYGKSNKPEYRLALAIVSIVLLVLLAVVLLISFAWQVSFGVGVVILGMVIVAMVIISQQPLASRHKGLSLSRSLRR